MARILRSLFALVRLVLVLFAATLPQRAFAEARPAGEQGTSLAAADTSQGSSSSGKDDSGDDDDDDDDGEEQR
ncbi:MAG TPA: hypothetical protein DEP35_20825 [Deltaproteobacteria bacterium]|jgi:hypothetical protein|nr:hypothetical protein [Deltaproteobacteria bacterium]